MSAEVARDTSLSGDEPSTGRSTRRARGVAPRIFDDGARVSDVFRHDMSVAGADIDALGHASNVAYLRWVQDVARAHSAEVGWDHEAYVRAGMIFVVRRHLIDYLRPTLRGDSLRVSTWIASWSAATSERRTDITRGDELIARAATTWALVSTTTGRPCRITPALLQAFEPVDDR